MSAASAAVVRPTLADHCSGVVKLVCGLDATQASDATALAAKFDAQLADFEAKAQRGGALLADVREAKYALCALIDERVMSSSYPASAGWSANPLQLRHFEDFAAGEVFYDRLDALRSAGARQLDALEIYGICLALGFTGKHTGERGAERRRVLLDQIVHEVAAARGGQQTATLGAAAVTAPIAARSFPLWLAPLLTVAAVLVVYLAVQAWVRSEVDGFARELSLGQGVHGS